MINNINDLIKAYDKFSMPDGKIELKEKGRLEFISKFPLTSIQNLKVDDYCLGTSENSFCYWLEFKEILFGIGGGNASKFGIYKSKDGNPTIKYDGKHYKCVENIGDFDKVSDVAAYGGDRCIRISVTEERPKDFCWTADPYKETDFFDRLLSLVPGSGYLDGISGVRASGISTVFGFMPVKKSTGYAKETQSIILNPSKESELQFGEIFKALKERWGWAWPGGGVITTG